MEKNKTERNRTHLLLLLLLLLFGLILLSLMAGAVPVSLTDIGHMLREDVTSKKQRIMLYVRIPRVAASVLAGAGLAVSGAIIQSVLHNPLAGPNIIGVNAGAGFAVVLCSGLLPGIAMSLPFAAFLGAFATVLFVYYLAKLTGASKTTLIMAGIAVNSLLNAATDAVYTFDSDALLNSNIFRIGGLSGVNAQVLLPAGIAIVTAILIAVGLHNELEVLSLGEETAKTLGLPIGFYRLLFLLLAAVLAGASVSFAGLLGFVGLIIPHIAKLLMGVECKYLLLTSAILGALFLTACDLLSRVLFAPFEVPVGIVLAFIGAPFFLYLLIHQRKRGIHD